MLTFMYEEDRIRALELYNDIFDEVGNETAVLQVMVSPTRQAVNLARAYDAKERRLQGDDEEPAYLQVIEQLRGQVQSIVPAAPKADAGQIPAMDQTPVERADTDDFDDFSFAPVKEKADELPVPTPQEIGAFPDEDRGNQSAPLSTPPAMAQEGDKPAPAQNVDEFADAVEAFLADFKIKDDALAGDPAGNNAGQNAVDPAWDLPETRTPDEEPAKWPLPPAAPPAAEQLAAHEEVQEKPAAVREEPIVRQEQRTVVPEHKKAKKPNIPLLILFIIAAVPIGLFCAGVILAAGLLSLALGASLLSGGAFGLYAAFSAFIVFADILLVFGLSLAALAFGLLFVWIFIWVLFGAVPGLIRGICSLARKLCYKEAA